MADSTDKGAPLVRPVSAGMLKNAEVGEIAVSLQRRFVLFAAWAWFL